MNILVLEGRFLVPELAALGHKVLTVGLAVFGTYDVGLTHPVFERGLRDILASRGFTPDLVLWCDDASSLPAIFGYEALDCVTMGYSIDQYCQMWHYPYSWVFDGLLCSQKSYLDIFRAEGGSSLYEWLPLYFDAKRLPASTPAERDIPVSFVGNLGHKNNPDRRPFLDRFKKLHPLFTYTGPFVDVFSRSRIVLNQSANLECNFRVFEAAGCGAALLTEADTDGLTDLFVPGEDILPPYPRGDAARAAAIAGQALAEPDRCREIGDAGQKKVLERHSARARARQITDRAEALIADQAWRRRKKNLDRVRSQMRTAFAFIATELAPTPEYAPYITLYQRLVEHYPPAI